MTVQTFQALATEDFVLLTTFRRDGRAVPTPVWVAALDGRLVVSTPEGTGKLKRLAHTQRVTLQPCSRRGAPTPGTTVIEGIAEVSRDPEVRRAAEKRLLAKYRLQWRVVLLIERIVRQGRAKPRPVVIIDPTPAG
ncbi:PPOX class F420-dependent oxidoreductase [Calidifontibacter sp. DB0510]|uniref:PPOX class F420-dependent oxidoreductase n=1 Tax=Metallococcus carri TaxID=1656884 RepID=A0A967B4U3_9MICO|nr:PPOX class F420-dependent oxidoreductase [Metallococcus carri]NHN57295.1 PPOX class F420-dependent oxidoreductase [Metallococcus carri]NOP38100.1 PPOX class F420-dependent oxidoreductase [Calidifontibacter sp. DB2511S]